MAIPEGFLNLLGIATPVCALARNDVYLFHCTIFTKKVAPSKNLLYNYPVKLWAKAHSTQFYIKILEVPCHVQFYD